MDFMLFFGVILRKMGQKFANLNFITNFVSCLTFIRLSP